MLVWLLVFFLLMIVSYTIYRTLFCIKKIDSKSSSQNYIFKL
ncbi:hypothetical protein M947_00660 [Sulfurimonas hongkongensis]|uniref:Uncharacterized protein n=1 Tax=Sulfurimonas hongkongensis TaxID=1172190 RepID=T0KTL3_9BACT|nr:hypothetical protein M947_00660 [Sulfurimonas hongkongensis]